jgi:chaperonin cofactor prefoldin
VSRRYTDAVKAPTSCPIKVHCLKHIGMGSNQPAQQDIQTAVRLHSELKDIQAKLIDFETKVHEHQVVVDSLESLDKARKCYRLIGGVLVERTVAQVLPTVRDNLENLSKVFIFLAHSCYYYVWPIITE